VDWKKRNNFASVSKLKFEMGFELKILEAKLLLNLRQIYFGSNWFGKIMVNSPKFLFALTFQNVNLDWHGCMAKLPVPIQASLDLVWKKKEKWFWIWVQLKPSSLALDFQQLQDETL
jgi:hypothetical protein